MSHRGELGPYEGVRGGRSTHLKCRGYWRNSRDIVTTGQRKRRMADFALSGCLANAEEYRCNRQSDSSARS